MYLMIHLWFTFLHKVRLKLFLFREEFRDVYHHKCVSIFIDRV